MRELKFVVDDNAVETVRNTKLTANFDEMKDALIEFTEPYKGIIVSADEISVAKSDRAKIRSVAKKIDDYRKMIKRAYTEPLKQFEDKCKQLTAICDEASDNIDRQVKEYERIRKEEKLFLLKDYYSNAENPYPEYATWEYLFDERWGNVTYSVDNAHKDIDEGIARIATEIKTIKSLRSEHEIALLDHYKQSHEIISTLALNERLIEQKAQREEAERRRQERLAEIEQERLRQEALKEATPPAMPEENVQPEAKVKVVQDEPEHYVGTFRVYGTYEEFMMLRQFMNRNGIQHTFEGMTATEEPYDVALCRSDWK